MTNKRTDNFCFIHIYLLLGGLRFYDNLNVKINLNDAKLLTNSVPSPLKELNAIFLNPENNSTIFAKNFYAIILFLCIKEMK